METMGRIKYFASLALLCFGLTPGNAAIRIAIAGISHESNSFNLTKATLADFEGEDALSGNRKRSGWRPRRKAASMRRE